MKVEDLKALAGAEPFREFVLKMQGGREFVIDEASKILLPEPRPDLVLVFDALGTFPHIIEIDVIETATVR